VRTLCLGEALVDLVSHEPVTGAAPAAAYVPHPGGAVANVAVRAARLGATMALAGGVGADTWGDWLHQRLGQEGVDLTWFARVEGAQTPVAFVTLDAAGVPSYAIYGDGIAAGVRAVGDRLAEAVEACEALFFSSNTLVGEQERELTLAARERALELGRPVVFDPNLRIHRWPSASRAVQETLPLVKGAFLLKCNEQEAVMLSGERDLEDAARGLLAAGARHVVITLGPDGAILRGGKMDRDVAAPAVGAVDTTGAGDAVTGVLLARLTLSGFYAPAIPAALPEAMEVAARSTEHWGAV